MTTGTQPGASAGRSAARPACEEVQALLTDYLARELGSARSDFVREHLQHCSACRHALADIDRTFETLKRATGPLPDVVLSLDEPHRRRLRWAALHPLLDWMAQRHTVVSLLAVLLALLLSLLAVQCVRLEPDPKTPEGPSFYYNVYPVRTNTPGRAP